MSRAWRAVGADAVAVLGTFAVLGVVCGVAWWLLVEPAVYTKGPGEDAAMLELEMGRRFGADGWFAVLAVVGGFLAGLAVTAWRSRDPLLTTLLLVPGSAVAAALVATVGRALGPESHDVVLATAREGQQVPVELAVSSAAVYLLWPVAVLAGAVMVLWSTPRTPAAPSSSWGGAQESSQSGQEREQSTP